MSEKHPDYLTLHHGMSGWKVCWMRWYEDDKMYDVMQTGIGRYEKYEDAVKEAKEWSETDNVEFCDREIDTRGAFMWLVASFALSIISFMCWIVYMLG